MKASNKKPLPLFYWSEIRFAKKDKENYGDLLSKYLAEKISGRPVKFVHPGKQPWFKTDKVNYLSVGSIIHHATKSSIVWGSGVIDREQKIASADFRAVRGPHTRNFLLQQNYNCPPIYGDPAILLPEFYNPGVERMYELGIIPHYIHYHEVKSFFENVPNILIIDLMTNDVEDVTNQILSCQKVISSSLHGLIVSHAYGIPGIWIEFSKKLYGDGIKFIDYIESVDIPIYQPVNLERETKLKNILSLFENFPSLVPEEKLEELRIGLKKSCPFRGIN